MNSQAVLNAERHSTRSQVIAYSLVEWTPAEHLHILTLSEICLDAAVAEYALHSQIARATSRSLDCGTSS